MLEILKQRKVAEELDDSPQLNRLTAQSLSNLFDERKSISNKEEVEELIKSYGMDVATFEALSRHITAPSVAKIKTEKEDEDETQIVSRFKVQINIS